MIRSNRGRLLASVFCLCTAFALSAQTAHAAGLAADDFAYPDGSLVPNGGWATHGGTAGETQVVSGQAVLSNGGGSEDVNLAFTPVAGVIYYGIDVSIDDLGAPYAGTDNEYFAHFRTGFDFRGRVDVVPPTGGGDFTFGFSNGSTATATWGTDLSYATTYRVIVRYDQNTDAAAMWVDAALESETPITATAGTAISMSSFAFRQSTSSGGETIRVDNLCVATTFAEAMSCVAGPAEGACTLPDMSCILTTAANCASQSGSYAGDNTFCPEGACILPDTSCIITTQEDCEGQGGTYQGNGASCPAPMSPLVINEVDADTPGTDAVEFVEIYNTGASTVDFSVSPHALVLYNGNGDSSYLSIDLVGTIAAGDYYVIGSSDVPNLDLDFCFTPGAGCTNALQNGADAVALYFGAASSYPNGTAVTATGLVDAVVYGTADADDAELLATLTPGQPQVDESANLLNETESNQRCPDGAGGALNTGSFTQFVATPGTANCVAPDPTGACILPDMSCVALTMADCATQSGTYQGDNTTCPTGACILPDTSCIITTDEDCTAQGGTYQGDASVCPTGACIVGANCIITSPADCTTQGGTYQGDGTMCPAATSALLINEVDADQTGVDANEFVELYNAGGTTIDFSITPHVLVFYNGSDNASELAVDLVGTVAPGDYYVVGSSTVANLDLDFCDMPGLGCTDVLQNGADAVALYEGTSAVFPINTPVTDASLVDALVYGTDDADDVELLSVLTPGQAQINEDGDNASTTKSMQRCPDGGGGARVTSSYLLREPTPGTGTICSGACCLPNDTCVFTDEISCNNAAGAYRGDGTSCMDPGICDCATIEDIKLAGTLGTGYILCNVTVVETVNQGGAGAGDRSFTVQDQSGIFSLPGGTERGIRIVGDVVANPALVPVFDALAEGDIIDVVGTTEDSGGTLYLRVSLPSNITETGVGGVFNVPTITPGDLAPGSLTAENLESVRVRVPCIAFTAGGGVFTANSSFNATDGITTFPVRINEGDNAAMPAIGTTIPSDVVELVGVFSQFINPQLYLNESDDILAPDPACAAQLGACCLLDASCVQVTFQICLDPAFAGTFQGAGVGCDPSPCVVVTGACCVDGVCTEDVEITACCDLGGIFLGEGTLCTGNCPDFSSIVINEIRIDQPGTDNDEYFELRGNPGTSLDYLTYIVIGDSGSGVIEAVVPLDGFQIQPDGLFLVAEGTFTLGGTVDLVADLNFENSDNVTHMLVANFTGNNGDDVDATDDCVIDDGAPWCAIVDTIGLVETIGTGDCLYGPNLVGPDGTFVPGHVYRCDSDPNGPWLIGAFDPVGGQDTPDAGNACVFGACCFDGGARGTPCACPGNFDDTGASMGLIDVADIPGFVAALLTTGDNCADINADTMVDGLDIAGMAQLVLNMDSCQVEACQQLTETTCIAMGGTFVGVNVPCDPDPCGVTGACCDQSSFLCDDVTAVVCASSFPGRTYLGDGTSCAIDCQITAIDILECGAQSDCTGITDWCTYQVDMVDLAGSTCTSGLVQQFALISIPCTGTCQTGTLNFRWVDGSGPGQDCIFSATYIGGTPACGPAQGSTFNLAP